MTKHASRLCVAVGSAVLLAGACEEVEKNEVPERVWNAAVAHCERNKKCGRLESTTSVEECADNWTKYFPWDEYTDECIEAWIAEHECVAALPCGGAGTCDFPYQLKTYHCWRHNTVDCGVMCGDPTSSEWQDCDHLMGASFGAYLPRLCSEQTPDYCWCGDTGCAYGEYCCSSAYCEEN